MNFIFRRNLLVLIMKKILLHTFITAIFIGLCIGCMSDDEIVCAEDFEGELVESENILVGQWVLSAIFSEKAVDLTDDDENNPIQDIYAQYSDCKNDRVYSFGANRRYTFVRGANQAFACKDESESEGTWKLTGETLSFVTSCSTFKMTIDFNEEESQFSLTDDYDIRDVEGNTIRAEVTFTYSLL